jgi:enterochelin esterase family protein
MSVPRLNYFQFSYEKIGGGAPWAAGEGAIIAAAPSLDSPGSTGGFRMRIARRASFPWQIPAALLLLCRPAAAQMMPGHEISPDRRVTFRVEAPNAQSVKVISQSDPAAMGAAEYELQRGDDGVWSGTTLPCRPGFHYYELDIDGFRCPDPRSQKYFGWQKWSSALEVPDPDLDFYLPKDVPHGDVHMHWYRSELTERWRKCLVYTPPDYGENLEKRYPVLYLQHGAGESELAWTMQGKANFILDNLIAEGRALPMIVVMDNGYANVGRRNLFAQVVIDELIPEVDREFRTLADREHRAIAGLSMGGGQALQIGVENLDKFASIGCFSGATRNINVETSYRGELQNAEMFNRRAALLWIGCGKLDRIHQRASELHEALEEHGIVHTWHESEGSHEWQVWREHLHVFAQALFRE